MVLNSTTAMYSIMSTFIFPLLKFANIYVDKDGILRPANNPDPEIAYTDEDRILCVAETNAQYQFFKGKPEQFEVFTPLINAKQCVFLANMVMDTCNKLNDVTNDDSLIYDEDLDEYIENPNAKNKTNKNKIIMFHMKDSDLGINNRIVFSKVDQSGNPIGKPEAEYVNPDILIATIGAIINLVKKYGGKIGPQFVSTDKAVIDIIIGIQRYKKEKQKEKKDKFKNEVILTDESDDELLTDNLYEMDDIEYAVDFDKIEDDLFFFPEDKKNQYEDLNDSNMKVCRGMILPTFKTVEYETNEEKFEEKLKQLQEIDYFADMDFED